MVVYKIVAAEEWAEANAAGVFAGAAVDRADGFIHFSNRGAGAGHGGQMVRRPRRFDPCGNRRGSVGRRLALGAVARRSALPSPLWFLPMSAVVWSRPLPLGADGAAYLREPCLREPLGVRLAKLASPVLRRLPAETAHRAGDQRAEDRAARAGAAFRSAPFGRDPSGSSSPIRWGSPPDSTRTPRSPARC